MNRRSGGLTRRGLGAAALGSVLSAPALAQRAWPLERPIEVVVPFAPGGGSDILARATLPHVQKRLPGANFVISNRPGASGQTGNEFVFNARPDGYLLTVVTSPTLVTIPIERPARYRVGEFSFIANVVDDPGGIWVRPASPYRSLADLLEAARTRPEGVSYGTTGVGSDDHLLMLDIAQKVPGTRFVHIPFNSSAPLQTAVMGGHLDFGSFNMSEGYEGLSDGRFRCLAQAGAQRWGKASGVPTLQEAGVALSGGGAQRGICGPPGLPAEIHGRLVEAFRTALADPAFLAEADRLGMPIRSIVGDEYRAFTLAREAEFRKLWAEKPWREG
ncbi:tripartite tricarboxylate transporter substrate binding protein [Roseomonas sp. SSH11]|uniref:Tripartite tricarboxylate transporter substrate binding protein n=2 Tax=Pararoseomonas baculiformis TaxID=2820812 RepID=A0ABS4AEU2_9PROT|nr:tripartite tricarboxylate transporter substrate binding protein [Pararoseomonas baculiformis]